MEEKIDLTLPKKDAVDPKKGAPAKKGEEPKKAPEVKKVEEPKKGLILYHIVLT